MTRALVTGGAGFIGSHLVERLLECGYDIEVVDDLSTGQYQNLERVDRHPRLTVTIGSILDENLIDRAVGDADMTFHLAAAVGVKWVLEHPLRSFETNLRGTENVLAAASRRGRRVLLASTSEVYGKNDSGPLREDDDRILGSSTITRWLYATTKAADEALALAYRQEHRLPTIIVRFFNTIGPRQVGRYGMVVPRFVDQALRNQPITVYGDGRQTRCFTYVGDVVQSLIALAECPTAWGEVFNVGRDEEISINALAERVIELTRSSSRIVHVPYEEAYGAGFEDMRRRVPDVSKLRRYIGYAPDTPLDQALRWMIARHPATADGVHQTSAGLRPA